MKFVYFSYIMLNDDYFKVWRSYRNLKNTGRKLGFFKTFYDLVCTAYVFGMRPSDYFSFSLYDKCPRQRSEYASMSYMYEFHRKMNDKKGSDTIENKSSFGRLFHDMCPRSFSFHAAHPSWPEDLKQWLKSGSINDFVLKDPMGTTGSGIKFCSFSKAESQFYVDKCPVEPAGLLRGLPNTGECHVEEEVVQHPDLHRLSPVGVNTVRVVTVINGSGEVDILNAVLRISVDQRVDNFSRGGLAAFVDVSTGEVTRPAVQNIDATEQIHQVHPVTGVGIVGLKIPYWSELVEMVITAALKLPGVRTVGWDVAITVDRPILIEGNPKWGKGLIQMASGHGIKSLLDKYLQQGETAS